MMDAATAKKSTKGYMKLLHAGLVFTAFLVSPFLGAAALMVVLAVWARSGTGGYSVPPAPARAEPTPSKREVMRCWMTMF